MEPLWSPVVATGGNRAQIAPAEERLKQAETVAVGCNRLPEGAHGKEGVDGSSPSEGFRKPRKPRLFFQTTCFGVHGNGCGKHGFPRPASGGTVPSQTTRMQ